jgi:hypothetical protein
MKIKRFMGEAADFELEPAQHDTEVYIDDSDYAVKSGRLMQPMRRNRHRSFDDGSSVKRNN